MGAQKRTGRERAQDRPVGSPGRGELWPGWDWSLQASLCWIDARASMEERALANERPLIQLSTRTPAWTLPG